MSYLLAASGIYVACVQYKIRHYNFLRSQQNLSLSPSPAWLSADLENGAVWFPLKTVFLSLLSSAFPMQLLLMYFTSTT